MLLGIAMAIPGAYMGIAGGWPPGYLLLLLGALIIGAALLTPAKRFEARGLDLESHGQARMFSRIPGYRIRFYALLLGLFCLGAFYATAVDLYGGWTNGQLQVFRGPKGHRVSETVFYEHEPWRFSIAVMTDMLALLFSGTGLVFMARCLVLGKRAFKR
jgi:hypothetical protein